ncbi:MAG TPA: CatB-related O-acetyltransferase [Prolixibacteraceae bacterium]|nr:CatB-related O-acetyltransferase [Prolixibacteraceae bacterium]
MLKYFLGLFLNLFNKGVSLFTLIDNKSGVSNKAKVYRGVKVLNSNIDSYSYVCSGTKIAFANIGKYCSIADGCSIGLAFHSLNNISTSPIFGSKKNATGHSWTSNNSSEEYKRVIVGNDVWIGTNAIILGGLKIGNGVIIGAGAIVTKDVPDYAIVVGVPAKIIKYRFEKPVIEKLMEIKWWNMSEEKLKENIKAFQIEHFSFEDLTQLR